MVVGALAVFVLGGIALLACAGLGAAGFMMSGSPVAQDPDAVEERADVADVLADAPPAEPGAAEGDDTGQDAEEPAKVAPPPKPAPKKAPAPKSSSKPKSRSKPKPAPAP